MMKTFKKTIFLIIPLILLFSGIFFIPVKAQDIDLDCVREKLFTGGDVKDCEGGAPGGTAGDIETNFFGITFTPTQAGIALLSRTIIGAVFGLMIVLAVLYGFYGIYVRSTAGDNEDKMKESVTIFKNAVLGAVSSIGVLVIMQIISVLLGLGNIWEFNFSLSKARDCDPTALACNVYETGGGTCGEAIGKGEHGECCVYNYVDEEWVKNPASCTSI